VPHVASRVVLKPVAEPGQIVEISLVPGLLG
jgi:hypothetical protein